MTFPRTIRLIYRIMSEESLSTSWRMFKIWAIRKFLPAGYVLLDTRPPVKHGRASRIRGIA